MKIIILSKKVIFFLFVFVVFFEMASLIASKFNLLYFNSDPPYFKKNYNGNKWRENNKYFGNWHKPNSTSRHKTRCFDVKYKSNNLGARDNQDYNLNHYNQSTILIGDSFAEGFGVNFEKTFFYYLKNFKKNSINLGVSGTNPSNHLDRFNYLIENKKKINELIYFFLPQNDWVNYSIYKNNENKRGNKDNDNLKNHEFKISIIRILDKFTYSINTIKTLKFIYFNKNTLYEKMSYNFEDKKSIDLTYKKILELLKLNIPKKTIIIIPTRKDFQFLNNTDYKNKYWYKKILSLSKKHNFKIIDLYEYFDSNIQYKYFLECDGHWSNFGNLSAFKVYKNQNH